MSIRVFGAASVYGVAGAVNFNAYVIPESLDQDQSTQIEEFMSGINQLLGFAKSNERINCELVLTPKAATLANARAGLAFVDGPVKVTLSGFPDDGGGIRQINGDYIYLTGARKSIVKGQASFRISAFRPLDVPSNYLTGGTTLDVAAVTAYITALCTEILA